MKRGNTLLHGTVAKLYHAAAAKPTVLWTITYMMMKEIHQTNMSTNKNTKTVVLPNIEQSQSKTAA